MFFVFLKILSANFSDDMYSRQSGPGSASGPPGAMQPQTGPNAGNSKPPSDYPSGYGGYGEYNFLNSQSHV